MFRINWLACLFPLAIEKLSTSTIHLSTALHCTCTHLFHCCKFLKKFDEFINFVNNLAANFLIHSKLLQTGTVHWTKILAATMIDLCCRLIWISFTFGVCVINKCWVNFTLSIERVETTHRVQTRWKVSFLVKVEYLYG